MPRTMPQALHFHRGRADNGRSQVGALICCYNFMQNPLFLVSCLFAAAQQSKILSLPSSLGQIEAIPARVVLVSIRRNNVEIGMYP